MYRTNSWQELLKQITGILATIAKNSAKISKSNGSEIRFYGRLKPGAKNLSAIQPVIISINN